MSEYEEHRSDGVVRERSSSLHSNGGGVGGNHSSGGGHSNGGSSGAEQDDEVNIDRADDDMPAKKPRICDKASGETNW